MKGGGLYMSSLDKIQKISKLGKILCSIVFVFCMIGMEVL